MVYLAHEKSFKARKEMIWEELRLKTISLIEVSEKLEVDKIQIKLKSLLPRYAPRSLIAVTNDEKYESYNIKGEA